MGITFVRDEADKKRLNPLAVPQKPGKVRRWVRCKGYDAQSHVEYRKDQGYEPVTRAEFEGGKVEEHPGFRKRENLDTTVTRGDLMLMECDQDRAEARVRTQQQITKARTDGIAQQIRDRGGEAQITEE